MCSNNGKKRKLQFSTSSEEEFSINKKGRLSDYPIVDGYECLGAINWGSYGIVYKVQDNKTGEISAMKKELNGISSTTQAEIDILQSIGGGHPSIIGFKKVAVDANGGVYVVMEYIDYDLRGYMAQVLPIAHVKMLMKQLLQGVNFLHQNRVVHRDLKPSNILVNKRGKLKICDFGVSMRLGVEDSCSSTVGTLWYMAPEMLLGEKKTYSYS